MASWRFHKAMRRAKGGVLFSEAYEKATLNFLQRLQTRILCDPEKGIEILTNLFTSKPELQSLIEVYEQRVAKANDELRIGWLEQKADEIHSTIKRTDKSTLSRFKNAPPPVMRRGM